MVGRVGVDPTIPEGVGFTVRCSCRFATYPYWSRIRGLNSYHLLGRQRCYHYTNTTCKNKINLILLCGQVYVGIRIFCYLNPVIVCRTIFYNLAPQGGLSPTPIRNCTCQVRVTLLILMVASPRFELE